MKVPFIESLSVSFMRQFEERIGCLSKREHLCSRVSLHSLVFLSLLFPCLLTRNIYDINDDDVCFLNLETCYLSWLLLFFFFLSTVIVFWFWEEHETKMTISSCDSNTLWSLRSLHFLTEFYRFMCCLYHFCYCFPWIQHRHRCSLLLSFVVVFFHFNSLSFLSCILHHCWRRRCRFQSQREWEWMREQIPKKPQEGSKHFVFHLSLFFSCFLVITSESLNSMAFEGTNEKKRGKERESKKIKATTEEKRR